MNKHLKTILLATAAICALSACATKQSSQQEKLVMKPNKIINNEATKPAENEQFDEEYLYLGETERKLVEQNNAFALHLFQQTVGKDSRVVSPLSITYLMAMLADGANGQTRTEILNTLGWSTDSQADADALCNMLINKSPKLDKSTTINIANYVGADKTLPLNSNYVDGVSKNFNAAVESLDFNSSTAVQRINNWCKKQTNGMIPKIIDETPKSTALIAMNAIYFNGAWANKFTKSATKEANFQGYTRDIKKVQMMHQNHKFDYFDNDTLQAVSLPYGNGAYAMTVLLPREGQTVETMMKGLDAATLSGLRYDMDECIVDMKLPRFTIETRTDLNEIISKLGAPAMFTPDADFSRMSAEQLYVSQMFQKAKIEVSEEGTKAAAVTAAVMVMASLHHEEPRRVFFHANRPFVYFITQQSTGAILFMGQYAGE